MGRILLLGAGKRAASGSAFDPSTLSPLVWFDMSDLSTMFQDAAASTPVTTNADPVRRINNKGSHSFNMQSASDSTRVAYGTGSGLHWVVGDAVDDKLLGTVDIPSMDDCEVIAAMRPAALTQTARAVTWQNGSGGYFGLYYRGDGVGNYRMMSSVDSFTTNGPDHAGITVDTVVVLGATRDRNLSTTGARVWTNGAASGGQATTADAALPSGSFCLNAHPQSAAQFSSARFYQVLIFNRLLTTQERADLTTWMGAKVGLTL